MPLADIENITKTVTIIPKLNNMVFSYVNGTPSIMLDYHLLIDGEIVPKPHISMGIHEASKYFPDGFPLYDPSTGNNTGTVTSINELMAIVFSMTKNMLDFDKNYHEEVIPPPEDNPAP